MVAECSTSREFAESIFNSAHNVIKMTLNLVLQIEFEMLLGNENSTAIVFKRAKLVHRLDLMILICTTENNIDL